MVGIHWLISDFTGRREDKIECDRYTIKNLQKTKNDAIEWLLSPLKYQRRYKHRKKTKLNKDMKPTVSDYLIPIFATLLIILGTILFFIWASGQVSEMIELSETETITKTIYFDVAPITAYSSIDSCHYPNCIMANGQPAHKGSVACPRDIPLGTKIKIGDTIYTCKDRTAKYLNGRYDIFMGYGRNAHQKALEFGIQKMVVSRTI